MSFVVKAVKKVYNKTKKVVKKLWANKWVRAAVLIGATVFTAGLAAGGFAAFAGNFAAAAATGASKVGAFFSAVGQTVATGWGVAKQVVAGAMSMGKGAVQQGVQAVTQGSQQPAVSAGEGFVSPLASNVGAGGGDSSAGGGGGWVPDYLQQGTNVAAQVTGSNQAAQQGGQGFFSKALGWAFGNTKGAGFFRGAVATGIKTWMQNEQYKDEQERRDNATVWGGPAFGGSSEPMQLAGVRRGGAETQAGAQAQAAQEPIAAAGGGTVTPAVQQSPEQYAASQQTVGSLIPPPEAPQQPQQQPAGGQDFTRQQFVGVPA